VTHFEISGSGLAVGYAPVQFLKLLLGVILIAAVIAADELQKESPKDGTKEVHPMSSLYGLPRG